MIFNDDFSPYPLIQGVLLRIFMSCQQPDGTLPISLTIYYIKGFSQTLLFSNFR